MQQVLDLHIHSKYSRACSQKLTLANILQTCKIKGVDIVATGDFTYPQWFFDIKNELEEIQNTGLYKLKTAKNEKVKFILGTELSLVYKDKEKCRRIHLVLHAPNIKAVEELNNFLDKKYNIRSDGRPILGMSAPSLMELCLKIHPQFLIYPAHIWTPWYSVFGSKSGFDCLEDCFGDYTQNIYAYETGLSSDPEMNWRLSALDNLTLISNSDAHSLPNIAREANVFDLAEVSYESIYNSIKNNQNLKYTIEFYPEEGMYHFDGHRNCGVRLTPTETKKQKGICPKCGRALTIGVDYRVHELADRPIGFKPKNAPGFKKLVELDKIIAQALGIKSRTAKKVQIEYDNLIQQAGTELDILLNIPLEKLKNTKYPCGVTQANIIKGIKRVRAGELIVNPGFDGQYGEVKIFKDNEIGKNKQQKLF